MGSVLERFDTRLLIFAGLLAFVTGYALFLRVDPSMSYVNFLLPTMLLLGTGFALAFPSINAQATAGVAAHEQGLASGLVNTSIQIGGAVVLAIITAIIGNHPHSSPGELIPGMAASIAVVVGVSAIGMVLTAAVLRAGRRASRRAATVISEDALPASGTVITEAEAVLCEVC
jgi:sugar phosphate permease